MNLLKTLIAFTSISFSVVLADSVNSPNITMNVDTNRSTGNGAGNTAVTVNTITIAETVLTEYSSGSGKAITLKVKPGYQFDPTSNITAQSATIGINGGAINATASRTPTGAANEIITFNLTSGTNTGVQDIIRVNGIKLKIISAEGAAGPAQNTLLFTSTAAGGAFSNQGIVATNITRGVADHLAFANQPGNTQAGADLLPSVKVVDFGGNVIINDTRAISLSIQTNPGSATLLGTTQVSASSGIATWSASNDLNITNAANGYVLAATAGGSALQTSSTVNSNSFNITAGNPGSLTINTQPTNTNAGDDILIAVGLLDEFGNPATTNGVPITLDSAVNPGGWPLLADTSVTKETVNGVASWTADDNLRITKAITDYKLSASGLGSPVTTNAFNISAGAASQLRFVDQPTSTKEGTTISPSVTVEVIDQFGNRTGSAIAIDLSVSSSKCGTLSGADGVSSASGLATFSGLSLSKPCDDVQLLANSTGLIGATSEDFTSRAKNAVPIALKSTLLKKGKLFKMSSSGTFTLPKVKKDDPTQSGASLTVSGDSGSVKYALPKSGWRKLGNGSFQFSGSRCENVTVSKKNISATCAGRTGSISLPESELDIVLKLGKGTAKFCGQCGGTSRGNESKTFNRSNCAKPEACE